MRAGDAVRLNALTNLVPPLAGLAAAPILARGLGVAERGDVAGVAVNITIAATALTLGLPEAATYFTGRDGQVGARALRGALAVLAAVGALAGLMLWFSADALGYSRESQSSVALVAATLSLVMMMGLVRGVAAGAGRWRRIGLERLITSLARLLGFAALWLSGTLTVTTAVATIVVTTLAGIMCYVPELRLALGSAFASSEIPQRLSTYAVRYWPGALAGALLVRIDQFLMVPLSTGEQLGIYVTAVTLFEATSFASNALRDVIFSVESKTQNIERVAAASRIAGLVTFAIALVVGVLAIPLVSIIFGQDFAGAVPVLAILLPASVLGASSSIAAAGLSGWGRAGTRSVGLIVSLVVKVLLVVLLVPTWGAMGAALATLAGTFVVWCVIAGAIWRSYAVSPRSLLLVSPTDIALVKSQLRRGSD